MPWTFPNYCLNYGNPGSGNASCRRQNAFPREKEKKETSSAALCSAVVVCLQERADYLEVRDWKEVWEAVLKFERNKQFCFQASVRFATLKRVILTGKVSELVQSFGPTLQNPDKNLCLDGEQRGDSLHCFGFNSRILNLEAQHASLTYDASFRLWIPGKACMERTRRLFQTHVVAHQLLNELKGELKVSLQSPKIKSLVWGSAGFCWETAAVRLI